MSGAKLFEDELFSQHLSDLGIAAQRCLLRARELGANFTIEDIVRAGAKGAAKVLAARDEHRRSQPVVSLQAERDAVQIAEQGPFTVTPQIDMASIDAAALKLFGEVTHETRERVLRAASERGIRAILDE